MNVCFIDYVPNEIIDIRTLKLIPGKGDKIIFEDKEYYVMEIEWVLKTNSTTLNVYLNKYL